MNQIQHSTPQLHLKKLDELLEAINNRIEASKKEPFLIAIDGRGGAGKSTIVNFLKEHMSDLAVLPLDDIVHPLFNQNQLSQFAQEVLLPLTQGNSGKYQKYDWAEKKHADWQSIDLRGVVMIDGLGSLDEKMIKYYDLTIWVDCDKDTAFQRGWKRDKNIYHVDTMKQWVEEWIPKQEVYIQNQQPETKADIIYEAI